MGLEPIHSLLASLATIVGLCFYVFKAGRHEARQDAKLEEMERRLDKGEDKFAKIIETLSRMESCLARIDQQLKHLERD